MTEKELRRLKRHDILELLLAHAGEADVLRGQVTAAEGRVQELEGQLELLKKSLDERDADIDQVKRRLDQRDERIRELNGLLEGFQRSRRIELDERGDIMEAARQLSHIFEEAERTAKSYEARGTAAGE